jgi:hypothetical protein
MQKRELEGWLARISRSKSADVVLLHYSVFSYGSRGVPHLVPAVLRALKRTGAPLVTLMHEYELSPWRAWGPRGLAFLVAQRPFASMLVGASTSVVVTTRPRLRQLERARWAPRRMVTFVPVCSTMDLASNGDHMKVATQTTIGVFGFAGSKGEIELSVKAFRLLPEIDLLLIGAPGADSEAAARWRIAAGDRPLRFTGILEERDLVQSLREADVVYFPETGPASRKTTVASALGAGARVVMLSGDEPDWDEPARCGAMMLAPRDAVDIARTVGNALEDEELGRRARTFYERRQSPSVVAALLSETMTLATSAPSRRHPTSST